MRRLAAILLFFVLSVPLSGQYSWRYSPSYTFDTPAFSKKDLASRADCYRRYAETQYNAPDFFQYDTNHHTSWFLSENHFMSGKKDIYAIIKFFVTILPNQGEYTVFVEKAEVFARSGMRILLDNEILRSDDSVYKDKLTKDAVSQIKAYIQEHFDGLIPKVREIMENPIDGFLLQELTE